MYVDAGLHNTQWQWNKIPGYIRDQENVYTYMIFTVKIHGS